MENAERQLPHVVVLGAGFAGLSLLKKLRHAPVHLTVIDRHNYHLFQPLLYQVATAALEPADIAGPIRQVIRGKNVEVLMADAVSIDKSRKCVKLSDRELFYDYLVVATGSGHSYFGHNEWEQYAPGLKTLEDAVEIRRRVLGAFEAAERCTDPDEQRAWMTFAVVGAGPTGVELAGAMAEIARGTKPGDFDKIDPRSARILLIEGLPRVLTAYNEELSQKALQSLERLGVTIQLNTKVTDLGEGYVRTDQERIAAHTVLWAAGVAASPIARSLDTELDKAGRVRVTQELTLKGNPEIYVLGDLAALEQDGKMLPGLAPVAMSQGKHAAKNIKHAIAGEPLEPFRYWDRGSFAVIGRGAAVGVAFKSFHMSGFVAWLMWLGIHLTFLVGFRNRIAVLFNWAYVYLTRRRYAQVIVGEPPQLTAARAPETRSSPLPEPPPAAREHAPQPDRHIH